MSVQSELPPLPEMRLELLEDLSRDDGGFLRCKRRRYVVHYPDGKVSAPFIYDEVDRKALDAVVIVPHFRAIEPSTGRALRYVYLRSAVRPPLEMREASRSAVPEPRVRGQWEVPAGLVEPSEETPEGVVRCARRELEEECGFDLPVGEFHPLGPSMFPCPGVISERHYYFHVEVDPARRTEPSLDGSALEAGGVVVAIPLAEALRLIQDGQLADAKTEIALRRLAELP
jgi:ADP-ribose pyrophosphatase